MINRLLQDLQGLQERNAMEVLPEVDKMMEALQNLRDNKLFELQSFAAKYGMTLATQEVEEVETKTKVETVVETRIETVVDTTKSEELGKQIIEDAKAEANAILENAKEEANALIISTREDLQSKIEAVLLNAEMEAEDIKSGAIIECNFIKERAKEEATNEADAIIMAANLEAQSIISEAKAKAIEIKQEVEIDTQVDTNTFDVSDALVEQETVIEVATDIQVNTSATIKTMEKDKRHENAHVGTATIGDRHVIFHSAKYMDMPMVYDACEGDEELIKQAILAQDPQYFAKAQKTYRYVDYTNKASMYLNADGVYVGYVDGYAVSWAKEFTVPSYLRYKYVNVKGFKPANKQEFISKVADLITKHDAGIKEFNNELEATKAKNKDLNYVVFSNEVDSTEMPEITIEENTSAIELLSGFEAFANME